MSLWQCSKTRVAPTAIEVAWLWVKWWNHSGLKKKKCVLQGKIRKFFGNKEDALGPEGLQGVSNVTADDCGLQKLSQDCEPFGGLPSLISQNI